MNMKQIKNYINEKLHVTTKSHIHHYTCKPRTKRELQEIIIKRIEEDGNDCDLNDIDVSDITDMSYLFNTNEHNYGHKIFQDFNGDISLWDVSNVKIMNYMFWGCKQFNCDLSRWNVSNVKDMYCMFSGCEQLNCDLSRWDVSKVERMEEMFYCCSNFDGKSCEYWNTKSLKNMDNMFMECPNLNADLSRWDISHLESLYGAFEWCINFDGKKLDTWDVSNVKDMRDAFEGCNTKPKWYNNI